MQYLRSFAALILFLPLALSAQETGNTAEPDAVVASFLSWYLPKAIQVGADVVYDKRMDASIDRKLLQYWRREQKKEAGIGEVPFIGQDYDEAWSTNFKVLTVQKQGETAEVRVRYTGPIMSQTVVFFLQNTKSGWKISGTESR